jgi:hypothetical protein
LQNSSGMFQGPEGMSSTALSASSRIRSFILQLRFSKANTLSLE